MGIFGLLRNQSWEDNRLFQANNESFERLRYVKLSLIEAELFTQFVEAIVSDLNRPYFLKFLKAMLDGISSDIKNKWIHMHLLPFIVELLLTLDIFFVYFCHGNSLGPKIHKLSLKLSFLSSQMISILIENGISFLVFHSNFFLTSPYSSRCQKQSLSRIRLL